MHTLVSLLLVAGVAQGGVIPVNEVVVGATASQYHAQNELGEYAYGYAGGPSAKEEVRTADGVTRGGYSYIDGHGLVQSAAYVSDPVNGFRVAATNLPVGPAVPDGPEEVAVVEEAVAPVVVPAAAPAPIAVAAPAPVVAAPAPAAVVAPAPVPVAPIVSQEFADDDSTIIESADIGSALPVAKYQVPFSVSDTQAVVQARAEHLAAVEQTIARNAIQDQVDAAKAAAIHVAGPAIVSGRALVADVPVAVAALPAAPVVAAAPAVVKTAAVVAPVPAVVRTAPVVAAAPAVVAAAPVVVGATSSQYHAQDELGQYSYGYAGGPSAKQETKTYDGITRGGYSYLDAHGLVQSAAYVSDDVHGFRVAATNLPVQPAPTYLADTPEVAAAKAHLFQAQAEHIAKL